MRLPFIFAALTCALVYSACGNAAPGFAQAGKDSPELRIRVEGGGWGGASDEAIQTVLYSVAEVLMPLRQRRLGAPIVVSHTDGNPVALYDRGPNGEYLVRLHASANRWHLYVYEFAHELCHVMSNYQENVTEGTRKQNQWLEETLCETASLFALKQLAAGWAVSPPAAEWSPQATKLQRFFDQLIEEPHRQLPPDLPFALWLHENESQLRNDPYQRQKNDLIASLLLPLFEQQAANWDSLCYLNLDPADASSSLEHYLLHWYQNAPAEHQPFVASLLGLLRAQDEPGAAPGAQAAESAVSAWREGNAGPARNSGF